VLCVLAQAGFIDSLPRGGCADPVASLNPRHLNQTDAAAAAMEFNMRAETQNLVEEIKQSVRLLRRHL
jgi:hypothetical protein